MCIRDRLSNNELTLSGIKENEQLILRILDRINKLELNQNTISNETHLIQQYLENDIAKVKFSELEESVIKRNTLNTKELINSAIKALNKDRNKKILELKNQILDKSELNLNTISNETHLIQQYLKNDIAKVKLSELEESVIKRNTLSTTELINSAIKALNSDRNKKILELKNQILDSISHVSAIQLPKITGQLRKENMATYNQVDALMSIYAKFKINNLMPTFRGWAISPDIAKRIAEIILQNKPQLVVSLGSGVSDLVVAYSLKENGNGKLFSIEHDEKYAIKTKRTILDHNLSKYVNVNTSELKTFTIDGKEWNWYGYNLTKLPGKIDMLIIDGPPGNTQKWARYPAIPLLYDYMAKGCIVILDDTNRKDEKEIIEMWKTEYKDLKGEYINCEKGAYYLVKK